jgi:hypothetical protein
MVISMVGGFPRSSVRSLRLHDPKPVRQTTSAAAQWAPLARFIATDARLERWAAQRPATAFTYEFIRFG